MQQKPINYISNRDLLLEIQRSKTSFCHFVAPEYATYHMVVSSLDQLTAAVLEQLISKHAEPVVRVMTDVHIPEGVDLKSRRKSSNGGWTVKINFPPFKHYLITPSGEFVEVGRSHWRDGLANGSFTAKHGNITTRLAQMFMLLVQQYSSRGNWRNYCVDQDTEALTQRGWLGIDDITEDDLILSYDAGQLKWSKIKSIYRGDHHGKMFHLTVTGMDALVTPGHKFITANGLKAVEHLIETDRIILSGHPVEDGDSIYDDAFVELVGWAVTEGNYYIEEGRNYTRISVHQNEGHKADRIRQCLAHLDARYGEGLRESDGGAQNIVAFHLTKLLCEKIVRVAPNKVPSMPFILSLSQHQREILIDTMIAGDGWTRNQNGPQNKDHVDAFLALCAIAGYRVSCKLSDIESFGKETFIHIMNIFSRQPWSRVENIDFHGGKRNGRSHPGRGKAAHPNEPTVDYNGKVWCPETEYGSFMARRNGYMYLTGNSYVDEMRNHALMHLVQVGLQFDETRSDNPFAFYTQIVKHVFTRIVNLEKRNQNIRDDLLVMAEVQPSYTRQVDNELDQRFAGNVHVIGDPEATLIKKEAKKRGRRPKVAA